MLLNRCNGNLCSLLRDDDSRAVDLFNENAEIFQEAFAEKFRQIQKSIHNFDYEEALAVLKII